jgi:hypothetical protein
MVRSGRDHMTAHVLDVYNTIPFNPERTDARVIQPFTTHRLYWIPPNLRHLHDRYLPVVIQISTVRKESPHPSSGFQVVSL